MKNNNKDNKIVFIKNNGLDMKEISISRVKFYIFASLSIFISFIIVSIFSTQILDLLKMSINQDRAQARDNEIKLVRDENGALQRKIIKQDSLINEFSKAIKDIKEKDEMLRQYIKLPSIPEDTRKLSTGGGKSKDQSYNDFNYLLPHQIDLKNIIEQLNFVHRTIKLEKISYAQIEEKIDEDYEEKEPKPKYTAKRSDGNYHSHNARRLQYRQR